ncbi:MAG: helix-turn-helix domain-containing protein [Planctomycetia bacterium]
MQISLVNASHQHPTIPADDSFLSLGNAAQRFARDGKPPHANTLRRWILDGVKTVDGRCVRLHALKVGRDWLVPATAIDRFIADQNPTAAAGPTERSPTDRRNAAEAALARLEREHGV